MPVRRLRTLAEAETATWREPGSPLLLATIRDLWALSERLCPLRFPPGLHRHRSLAAANRQTEQWEAAAVAARRR